MDKSGSGYLGYIIAITLTLLALNFSRTSLGIIPLWWFPVIAVISILTHRFTVAVSPKLGINVGGAIIPVVASLFMLQGPMTLAGPLLLTAMIGIGLFTTVFAMNSEGSLVITLWKGVLAVFLLAFIMELFTQKQSSLINLIPLSTVGIFGGDSLRASRYKTVMIVGYFGINDAIWITFGMLSLIYFIVALNVI
jgi:hypothetical protein